MKQTGFTLVELITVIVILGILAAIAMPRMINAGDDARNAAVQGIAGALTSAYNLNFANRQIDNSRGVVITGTTTASICDAILPQMLTRLTAPAHAAIPARVHALPVTNSMQAGTAGQTSLPPVVSQGAVMAPAPARVLSATSRKTTSAKVPAKSARTVRRLPDLKPANPAAARGNRPAR